MGVRVRECSKYRNRPRTPLQAGGRKGDRSGVGEVEGYRMSLRNAFGLWTVVFLRQRRGVPYSAWRGQIVLVGVCECTFQVPCPHLGAPCHATRPLSLIFRRGPVIVSSFQFEYKNTNQSYRVILSLLGILSSLPPTTHVAL